jgi:uncharacterized RDD family membrane protein YckC
MAFLPDPGNAPELYDGVLTRRVMAFGIDAVILATMVVAATLVGAIAGFLTFGLAWVSLIVVLPAVIVLYYAATLGSPRRATVGMQVMDLVLTPTRGRPLDGAMAFLHAALFWLTFWISWPVSLAFALFTPRRQMLHDLIVGTLMLRRSPMERHWAGHRAQGNQA